MGVVYNVVLLGVVYNVVLLGVVYNVFSLMQVSNKIYAALLPRLGKLQVVMDTKDSLVALYQLFVSMSPNIINIQVGMIISYWY